MQRINAQKRMNTFKTEESCFSQKSKEQQNQNETYQQLQPQLQAPRGQISNNYRSKRQFATLDEQFQHFYNSITSHEYFAQLNKHSKIRINKWLTKLSNISVNQVWKKNRNNYIKLIKLMFDCEVIIAPINCIPPQRDLHKLTNHEMNVIIDQVQKIVQERDNTNTYQCDGNEKFAMICVNESSYVDHQKSEYQVNKSHLKSHSKSKDHHFKSAQKSLLKIPKYPSTQQNIKNKQNIEIKQNFPNTNNNTTTNSKLSSESQNKVYTNQQSQMKKSAISSQYFSRKARTILSSSQKSNKQNSLVQSHETTDRNDFLIAQDKDNQNISLSFSQQQDIFLNTLIKGMRLLNKFQQIQQQQEFVKLKELFNKNQINFQFNNNNYTKMKKNNSLQLNNGCANQLSNQKLQEITNSTNNLTRQKLINIVQNYCSQNKYFKENNQEYQQKQCKVEVQVEQKSIKKKQKLSLMTRVSTKNPTNYQHANTTINIQKSTPNIQKSTPNKIIA